MIVIKEHRKELKAQYSGREIVGGVYGIRNQQNNKIFIEASVDLQGSKNRFDFAQKTNLCPHFKLQADWSSHGSAAFVFEVLEELQKGEGQTAAQFKADIDILVKLWGEKTDAALLY